VNILKKWGSWREEGIVCEYIYICEYFEEMAFMEKKGSFVLYIPEVPIKQLWLVFGL
jgi:hypothetical protein